MKQFALAFVVIIFGALAWLAASQLDSFTLGMAIGMIFGVLAGVPVALLTLAANNRRADDDEDGPPPPRQSAIILDAPVAPAAPALPTQPTRRAAWTQAQVRRLTGFQYVDDTRTRARLAACGVQSLPCTHALLANEDVAILRVYYAEGYYAKAALPLTAQAATAARHCCDDPAAIAVEVHHRDAMIFAWMRPAAAQPAAGSQLARRPSCHVRPQPPRLRQAADDDEYYEAVTVEEELSSAATQPANWDAWGDDDDPEDPPDAWGDDEDDD
jgi:hypothetical protein